LDEDKVDKGFKSGMVPIFFMEISTFTAISTKGTFPVTVEYSHRVLVKLCF